MDVGRPNIDTNVEVKSWQAALHVGVLDQLQFSRIAQIKK